MQPHPTPVLDNLAFKPTFRAALGGMSGTTFDRHRLSGLIPKPDAYIGNRPVWRLSTIEATINKLTGTIKGGA